MINKNELDYNINNTNISLNVMAPRIQATDVFGRDFDTGDYKGKSKLFIGFFRHAGCPFCNLRVHALSKMYEELKEASMEMVFLFESSKETILRSTFLKGMSPIPIISDPERYWYNIYGIENDIIKSSMSHLTSFIQTAIKAKLKKLPIHPPENKITYSTLPAEFLIDEGSILRMLHYSQGLNDRISLDYIRDFARSKTPKVVAAT